NSTLSGNVSNWAGGGIANEGTATITSSTLTGGVARAEGGGISNAGVVTLNNTIVASSSNGDLFLEPGSGHSFGGSHNLIDEASAGVDASSGYFGATSFYNVPAGLDPNGLQDNGGPTQTIALVGGFAINAADDASAPATDQRGFARVGTADIGAFE